MNTFTLIFLVLMLLGIVILFVLATRHISHVKAHSNTVPDAFKDKIPLEAHKKAAEYTQAKVKAGLFDYILGMVLLVIWTLGGGLQQIDELWRSFNLTRIWTGIGFIFTVYAIMAILDLPMSIYRTFNLEQRFGFNKTSPKTFVMDIIKNALLTLLIGAPIVFLVLWIMENAGTWWWIYAWITTVLFTLFFTWAYPAFIAPIFNKFKPLENTELKTRIENLLTRNGFKSQGIFVMDGSLRSTHGNAYFAGFGDNKRIVFFDTLIDIMNYDEIEAVLAHELGHFRCNHVKKLTALQVILFFIGFTILGWLIEQPWFYHGLGVSNISTYMALMLFIMVIPIFTIFITPIIKIITRKYEFEADDFAAAQAQTGNLIHALVKLYRENANTLTPDPMYSAFHDSHPPAPIRIAHLSAKLT